VALTIFEIVDKNPLGFLRFCSERKVNGFAMNGDAEQGCQNLR
jgi:hypothetical protein